MDDLLKMEFLSKAENESFARAAVAAFVSRLNPTIEQINDIKTAVSEAVTNCIVHGYEHEEGIIKIVAEIHNKNVKIQVIDFGKGIEDVKRAREPLFTTKADRDRSGMGFTFMEIFMDELKVESCINSGTKVYMSKNLDGGK